MNILLILYEIVTMVQHLSEFEMGLIVAYRHQNPSLSYRQIAKKLKRSYNTIYSAYKRYEKRGTMARKRGSGRPRKTNKRQRTDIILAVKRDPYASVKSIRRGLKLTVSLCTINRIILESGLRSFFTEKKPLINERNRVKRLIWAKEHIDWDLDDWKSVLWSDESSFRLEYRSKRRVRRPRGKRLDPKYTKPTIKYDKKINVWGCFSWDGVGHFYQIKGIMDARKYHSILQQHMFPSADELFGDEDWIFSTRQ